MKRLYFYFNFWNKNKENIALLENKKFGKGCFKPSEHILYLNFFRRPTVVGGIIRHPLSNFCPGFLMNQVGMSVSVSIFYICTSEIYLSKGRYTW